MNKNIWIAIGTSTVACILAIAWQHRRISNLGELIVSQESEIAALESPDGQPGIRKRKLAKLPTPGAIPTASEAGSNPVADSSFHPAGDIKTLAKDLLRFAPGEKAGPSGWRPDGPTS